MVLDLGCGSGALGEHLSSVKFCTVDGATFNREEAACAQKHYRRVDVIDLEVADLTTLFPQGHYDAVVCADVLEHLRHPEMVLTAIRSLLKPDGKLLVSVPNAGYCGLLAELLQGEFKYREEGLLDRTHLRFYTRQSLLRFLSEEHWTVDLLDTITLKVPDSEFSVAFDLLPPAVSRYLLATPDAQVYQFIGIASPRTTAGRQAIPTQHPCQTSPAQAYFTAQLYLGRSGTYSENEKITGRGEMGRSRQTLIFPLPHSGDGLTELRLDPADRPGFMHLYRLTLRDAHGNPQWQWMAESNDASLLKQARHDQIVWNLPMPGVSNAALLLLAGDDPWIKLPIHPSILKQCLETPGAQLEVDAGWPMSADYLALSSTVRSLTERSTHLEASLSKARTEATVATTTVQQLRLSLQAALQQPEILLHELEHSRALYSALEEHVRRIETSTAYRATRPLVRAKMRLTQWRHANDPTPPMEATSPAPQHTEAPPETHSEAPAPALAPAEPASMVDIIVPVYRGLRDTQVCIESVLQSTVRTPFRLVIINDASPEPDIQSWLERKAQEDGRILLLKNDRNLGFVGTVNRGMSLDQRNDILLLNSDTEVANDWLDRLRHAAYSAPNVATVTPFSNNATICSYPRFCADNELPPGYDTRSLDQLFAQTHAHTALDIPTGVGFCMYIRRDCLEQVGLFDAERFGLGYGEENDFCQRALQNGWRNLHALDIFVRHTGGVSFGDAKSTRELQAQKTLQQLHPHYESSVQAFVSSDPARPFREALDLQRLQRHSLPRLLFIVHSLGGGTQRHTKELAEHFLGKLTTLQLMPLENHHLQLEWLAPGESMQWIFHWPTQSARLLELLRTLRIERVHFHHILGLDPEIMCLPNHLGVPYDFTAHDYYTACPQIALVTSAKTYCQERGTEQCNGCLQERPAPTGEGIMDWRLRHACFLQGADNVLAPSRDAARRLARYFPTAKVRFAPHLDISDATPLPMPFPHPIAENANLRVLVLGAVGEIKGADVLEATALEAARQDAPIEFHLMGYAHRKLQTQPHASLSIHGAYNDADLQRLLVRMKPDLVWFPAVWPETYSYTLSACLLAGVAVVAPNLGSFPERLNCRRWTWLMPWNTPPLAWLDFFLRLREQHFCAAQEPPVAPAFPPAPEDAFIQSWSYDQDYLHPFERLRQNSDNPA